MPVRTLYEISTGKLSAIVGGPESSLDLYHSETVSSVVGGHDGRFSFAPGGIVTERQSMPVTIDKLTVTADGVDACILSAIPSGAVIAINGEDVGISDGTPVELTFDLADAYRIKVTLFPWLDYEVTINAN